MKPRKYVAYYRVSTQQQGRSGLGLEAQQQAVQDYLGQTGRLVGSFTDIESGRHSDRPALSQALAACRLKDATLVIAKLDRLARNVAFISGLMESGVDFVACDFPQANRLTVHILAAVAEYEAKMCSERTRAALQAARARGVQLGGDRGGVIRTIQPKGVIAASAARSRKAAQFHAEVLPRVKELRQEGRSLRAICSVLHEEEVRAPRGGRWNATILSRILAKEASL